MNAPKCYKCECVIDNIVNNNMFSKPASSRSIYVCESCAEIKNDKKVKWPDKTANEIIDDLNGSIMLCAKEMK